MEKNKNINPNIYILMEIMKRARMPYMHNIKGYKGLPLSNIEMLLYIAAYQDIKKVYFEDLCKYTDCFITKVKNQIFTCLSEYIEVSIDKKPNVKGPAKTVKLTEKGHEYIANLLDVLSGAPQTEPHAEGFSSGLPEARHADGFSSAPQTAGVSAGLSEAPQAKDVSVMSDDVAVAAI